MAHAILQVLVDLDLDHESEIDLTDQAEAEVTRVERLIEEMLSSNGFDGSVTVDHIQS